MSPAAHLVGLTAHQCLAAQSLGTSVLQSFNLSFISCIKKIIYRRGITLATAVLHKCHFSPIKSAQQTNHLTQINNNIKTDIKF